MEVMLVEDDADLRQATTETLEQAGFRVHAFEAALPALAALAPDFPGVILSDLRMPGLSGLDFLDRAREVAPEVPFILITAHGDVPAAIRAMRGGAHDFLEKPCAPELMLDVLRRAQAMRDLHLENARLRQTRIEDRLIGRSAAMKDLRQHLRALAGLQLDLLIAGETGTGKELAARILHDLSPHADGPFVAINCGALSEAEVDRELFGTSDAPGLIARAEGGTLYLDELESMPDGLQVRLLRVVESREITPLGAAPFRSICAFSAASSAHRTLWSQRGGCAPTCSTASTPRCPCRPCASARATQPCWLPISPPRPPPATTCRSPISTTPWAAGSPGTTGPAMSARPATWPSGW